MLSFAPSTLVIDLAIAPIRGTLSLCIIDNFYRLGVDADLELVRYGDLLRPIMLSGIVINKDLIIVSKLIFLLRKTITATSYRVNKALSLWSVLRTALYLPPVALF